MGTGAEQKEEIQWRIALLDAFSISGPTKEPLTSRKAIAMLTFLARQRERSTRRDTLANLLWENVDTAQARVNLRQPSQPSESSRVTPRL